MNVCSAKIILRKDALSKRTGLAPLALQVFINGGRLVLSINMNADPALWDPQKEQIQGKGTEIRDNNLVIAQCKSRANEIFTEYRLLGAKLTKEKFRELFLEETSRKDFVKFYESEMEKRHIRGLITDGSLRAHQNTLIKLKKFSKGCPILFNELNSKWVTSFDSWHSKHLKAHSVRSGKPQVNNSINTRHNALKNIKTYLNIAAKDEAIRFTDPFEHGMPIKEVKGNRDFLTPDELRKMIELYFNESLNPVQRGVLARFICSCFTSIRISDHMKLKLGTIEGDCMVFKPKKTERFQKTIRIPLNRVSRFFIDEIRNKDFVRVTDQKSNLHLKGLASLAGVNKHVTSHVGRHTFATTFLMLGGQVHVLQQIMAHADIKTTMVYVHMIDDHMVNQMQIMNSLADGLLPESAK